MNYGLLGCLDRHILMIRTHHCIHVSEAGTELFPECLGKGGSHLSSRDTIVSGLAIRKTRGIPEAVPVRASCSCVIVFVSESDDLMLLELRVHTGALQTSWTAEILPLMQQIPTERLAELSRCKHIGEREKYAGLVTFRASAKFSEPNLLQQSHNLQTHKSSWWWLRSRRCE